MLFDVAELQGSAGSRPPSEASAAVGSRPWIIRGLAPSVLFAILAFWRNQLAGVGNTTRHSLIYCRPSIVECCFGFGHFILHLRMPRGQRLTKP